MPSEKAVMKILPNVMENPGEAILLGGGEGLAPLRLSHLAPGVALPFHIFTAAEGPRNPSNSWQIPC